MMTEFARTLKHFIDSNNLEKYIHIYGDQKLVANNVIHDALVAWGKPASNCSTLRGALYDLCKAKGLPVPDGLRNDQRLFISVMRSLEELQQDAEDEDKAKALFRQAPPNEPNIDEDAIGEGAIEDSTEEEPDEAAEGVQAHMETEVIEGTTEGVQANTETAAAEGVQTNIEADEPERSAEDTGSTPEAPATEGVQAHTETATGDEGKPKLRLV